MVQELSIVTAAPVVTLTKAKSFNNRFVEVQASDPITTGLSIHYAANVDDGGVPTVRDQLLVAVLAGVHPQWLSERPGDEKVAITFQAVSANQFGSGTGAEATEPSRANQFDTLHFSTVDNGVLKRLGVSMRDESSHTVHAQAVLSKGQVTSMLAALLAIYPQLKEE